MMRQQQEDEPPSRRLVAIDLGIASRHSVRVLEADGRQVCRSSRVPTVASLSAVEQVAWRARNACAVRTAGRFSCGAGTGPAFALPLGLTEN